MLYAYEKLGELAAECSKNKRETCRECFYSFLALLMLDFSWLMQIIALSSNKTCSDSA